MRVDTIERDSDGKLPSHAWPRGYQLVYYAADNGLLCPACANAYVEGRDTEEQLKPVLCDVFYEGPAQQCENCDAMIESAYGDPDATEKEGQ